MGPSGFVGKWNFDARAPAHTPKFWNCTSIIIPDLWLLHLFCLLSTLLVRKRVRQWPEFTSRPSHSPMAMVAIKNVLILVTLKNEDIMAVTKSSAIYHWHVCDISQRNLSLINYKIVFNYTKTIFPCDTTHVYVIVK